MDPSHQKSSLYFYGCLKSPSVSMWNSMWAFLGGYFIHCSENFKHFKALFFHFFYSCYVNYVSCIHVVCKKVLYVCKFYTLSTSSSVGGAAEHFRLLSGGKPSRKCGIMSSGNHLFFSEDGLRMLVTNDMDLSNARYTYIWTKEWMQ